MTVIGLVFACVIVSSTRPFVSIFTLAMANSTPLGGGDTGNEIYTDCRSTDTFSFPSVARLLFTLLQISSSARYFIALLSWLWPLFFIFLLPVVFVAFLYITALALQLYVIRHWLMQRVSFSASHNPVVLRQLLQRLLAALWSAHGRIFHGYEICGVEKLPKKGPAFLVYYHGTLPLDTYYLIARYQIDWNR